MKKNRFTLPILLALAVVAGAAALPYDWPLYGRDAGRNAYATAESHYNLNYTGVVWAYQTGGWVQSSPVAGDVNNDGRLEIAAGSDDGNLYLLNSTGSLLWNRTTGGRIRTSPAIGNLNMDPYLEVVVASEDNTLYAFDHNGNLLWSRRSRYPIETSPAIVEVSYNNRGSEVVYSAGDVIYILDGNGAEIQSYRFTEDIKQQIAVADINNDGSAELIVASSDGTIYVFSRFFTAIKKFVVEGERISPPIVADMNGDSMKDAVFASLSDGAYHVYHTTYSGANSCQTGTCLIKDVQYLRLYPQWKSASTSMLMPPLAVADLDGNGRLDIVLKTADNTISAFNGSGFNAMTYSVNGLIRHTPVIADLDGDSTMEIIFGADDGNLYMLNYPNGSRLIIHVNGSIRTMPAVADLNRDGKLEVIFGSDDGNIYVVGDAYLQTQRRANESLTTAAAAVSAGDKTTALEHISTALGLYLWLKDEEGVSLANSMMGEINSSRNADIYLENTNTAYATYDLQEAERLGAEALRLYELSNNLEGQINASDLMGRIRVHVEADGDYKAGVGLYNSEGVSQKAFEHLNKARAGYVAVGYEPGVSKADAVIKRLAADGQLQNASDYYSSGEYDRAREHAEKALALYSELNYEEGMNLSVKLIGSSLKASSAQSGSDYTLYTAAGLIGLLALILIAVLSLKFVRNFIWGGQAVRPPVDVVETKPWFEAGVDAYPVRKDSPAGTAAERMMSQGGGTPSSKHVEPVEDRREGNTNAGEDEASVNARNRKTAGVETGGVDERLLSAESRLKSLEERLKKASSKNPRENG